MRAKAKAIVSFMPVLVEILEKALEIWGAASWPMRMAPARKPKALRAMRATLSGVIEPPVAMAETMARTKRPKISSMTAAPRTVLQARDFWALRL